MAAKDSIRAMLGEQDDQLLRKGTLASERYDQIRQRHIWSTFYLTKGYQGSALDATAMLAPLEMIFFAAGNGQNGQGLPQGFQLSELDTNFPGTGRVSDDQNFIVWEIGVSLLPMRADVVAGSGGAMSGNTPHPDDCDRLLDDMIESVRYLTNEVPYGPANLFAQSGAPAITVPSALDTSGSVSNNANQVKGGQGEDSTRQARVAQNAANMPAVPSTRRKLDVPIYMQAKQTFAFKLTTFRQRQLLTLAQGGTCGFRVRLDWWSVESFREQG
jgi:hypothetical protein